MPPGSGARPVEPLVLTEVDRGEPCGADASLVSANAALQTFDAGYDVERKFRETRHYQVAPISTNLILSYVAEYVLGLPRSF
jgi:hypothetical protein